MTFVTRALWWFLICASGLVPRSRAEPAYYFKAIGDEKQFPAPSAELLYLDARTAIEIIEVRYDGRMAAPVIGGEGAIKPNLVTGPGKPGVVVYAMPHDKLESWRSLAGANAKSERVTYADDGGVVVEIWYRVRYPSGKRTATLKVVFTSDDQSINRITIP